ncbi:MAG TPA: peroxiredoxin-like family protein [Solirubrobacteraceae bacterium]|nr:peroxiredoxin-like family protein [Solirubrobacteraceae bacterium]
MSTETGATIAEQAAQVKAASATRLPPEVGAAFASEQAALDAAGVPAETVALGAEMAQFALPDANGRIRTLTELTADGPAVIVFYRGGWCPFCNVALRTYQRDLLPELQARGAALVAISPETPDASLSTQEKAELAYAVLSDDGARLARDLGITFQPRETTLEAQRALGVDIRATRPDAGTVLPMPTVLIVDQDQVVRFVDIHPDYTTRTEVEAIISLLDGLAPVGG